MQSEIFILLFGDNIGRAIFPAISSRVVAVHCRPCINWVIHNEPFDRKFRRKPRAFPIGPLFIQHFPGAIKQNLRIGRGFYANANPGFSRTTGSKYDR